jgi:hypothetical protein
MRQDAIRVLLLSETEHGCANLRKLLEKRGCHCKFGSSFNEAMALFGQHTFDLVLSTIPFQQYDHLLSKLSGLPSTVFQCFLVEDGCWWLPLAQAGQPCLGVPALRAAEFLEVVGQIVEDVLPGRVFASRARA